jgi:cell division protein FtsZ
MGFAMMGTAVAEGDNKAVEASNLALTNPLIENIDMNTAKGVIVNISGGSDMTLLEVDHAANIIRQSVNPDANIIFGSLIDETLQGKLKISIFATGIEATGKKILYYPESENSNSGFSSIQNKLSSETPQDSNETESMSEHNNELNADNNPSNSEFHFSPQDEDISEIVEDIKTEKEEEISVNYTNLEEKKKTGFFSMLSNLMSSDKDKKETSEETSSKEKKIKAKKTKTDPNLFLFSDVVEDTNNDNPPVNNEGAEISDITEINAENELLEDIDTPSYLRKGSTQ